MDVLLTHAYFLYEDPHELAVMKPLRASSRWVIPNSCLRLANAAPARAVPGAGASSSIGPVYPPTEELPHN